VFARLVTSKGLHCSLQLNDDKDTRAYVGGTGPWIRSSHLYTPTPTPSRELFDRSRRAAVASFPAT